MSTKRVALITADEGLLQQIELWLYIETPDLELKTFTNPKKAYSFLRSLPKLDQIITSESFPEVGGPVWLKALRKLYSDTPITVLASNEDPDKTTTSLVMDDPNATFLTQPLERRSFFSVSEEDANTPLEHERGGIPASLTGDQHQRAAALLEDIQENVNAHSIYLVDYLGQSLVHLGNAASQHIVEIASLLGGSFAALLEVGEIVDEDKSSMNLIYRQGEKDDIYALSVASNFLLILLIARGPYATRVGTVWYYVREVAPTLADILNNLEPDPDGRPFGDDMTAVLDKELESMFPTATLDERLHPVELQAEGWPFAAEDQTEHKPTQEESASSAPGTGELLDLQSASELGLIPEDIFERFASENEINLATDELKAE